MKLGATELGKRRAVTPRLSCEIPSDVCYCKYAEALYVCLAGGWHSQEVELTEGWQSQRVAPARVELSGRWNSLAGVQRSGIHLLGTPARWNSFAGDSNVVETALLGT